MSGPLIAVWSPKGGVGKTVIAAGLAMQMARDRPTLLIDLDAGKSDVAPLLNLPLRPSILEYANTAAAPLEASNGLSVLPGPARLTDESHVTGEMAKRILERASLSDHAVIADVDADLRDSTVVTLERADAVLLVTTPDLSSIFAVRRFLQEAPLIMMETKKFHLVINRVTLRPSITEAEILKILDLPLAGRIPSLPDLPAIINRREALRGLNTNPYFAASLDGVIRSLLRGLGEVAATSPNQPQILSRMSTQQSMLKRWWRNL